MKRHAFILISTLFFVVNASAVSNNPLLTFRDNPQCSVASDNVSTFCQDFKTAVQACCPLGKIPMSTIYNLMISTYGSLAVACQANAIHYGSNAKDCEMQWNCYWNGGTDANGDLCSTTGKACDSLS